jgi:MFS family permease
MNRFSPSDAALEGFRITRENPKAFAWWAGASFLVSVLGVFVTVLMPPNVRNAMNTLAGEDTPDIGTLLDALIAVSPLFVFGLAFQCMMAAAVYREIFRHEDSRFGYLRLGADELRLMALTLIFVLMAILMLAGATLGAAIVGAIASFGGQSLGVSVGAIAELFFLGLAIYVLVRLSLAPAATFAERHMRFRESWTLTHGAFWRLFGAYLLAFACIVVVGLLAMVLFSAVAGIIVIMAGGQLTDLSAIFHPDETSFRTYLNPGMIAYMIVGSLFNTLYYAVIAAPGALVYRELHDNPDGPIGRPADAPLSA